jgi:peptide/nickel transport system ATP-binding protein
MQHGRIVEQGPAAQVLTHPQQAYTRALLDAAPGRGWDFANFRPVVGGRVKGAFVIPGQCAASNPE